MISRAWTPVMALIERLEAERAAERRAVEAVVDNMMMISKDKYPICDKNRFDREMNVDTRT